MDWSNERYVRIYTRDSRNLKLFGWEGRALLWETIRKADRAGVIEGVRNADDLALMVEMPVEVVRSALARIQSVDPDTIQLTELGVVLPSYIPANESKQSDRQRQRESRARRSAKAREVTPGDAIESPSVTELGESVTAGHSRSHAVTACHSVPCRAVPSMPSGSVPSEPRQVSLRSTRQPSDIDLVFGHWKQEHGHPRAKLDHKRRSRISARLKDFSADQLCQAITNAHNDPWLMGEDPKASRKYDGLETLLRDTTQVERLLELTTKRLPAAALPPRTAASNATFDSVRRKAEEARAQEAAEEAQRERLLPQ